MRSPSVLSPLHSSRVHSSKTRFVWSSRNWFKWIFVFEILCEAQLASSSIYIYTPHSRPLCLRIVPAGRDFSIRLYLLYTWAHYYVDVDVINAFIYSRESMLADGDVYIGAHRDKGGEWRGERKMATKEKKRQQQATPMNTLRLIRKTFFSLRARVGETTKMITTK